MHISDNTTSLQNLLNAINEVSVSHEPILQDKTVIPTAKQQDIIADEGYDGLNVIIVEGDENLVADNIKNGINIFGVNGTLDESSGNSDVENAIISRTISIYENDRVEDIGSYAFYNCFSLTSVSFPACTDIGRDAFLNCTSLTSVSFPACTNIESYAFMSCRSLETISFPKCTNIGWSAFFECDDLTSANFPKCTDIGSGAFMFCSSLTSVSFSVCLNIGSNAFAYCSYLTTVSFHNCRGICIKAFSNCYKLKSLYLTGRSLCNLSNSNAFTSTPIGGYSVSVGCYGSIYVPQSLLASYQAATNWTYFSSRFVGV